MTTGISIQPHFNYERKMSKAGVVLDTCRRMLWLIVTCRVELGDPEFLLSTRIDRDFSRNLYTRALTRLFSLSVSLRRVATQGTNIPEVLK